MTKKQSAEMERKTDLVHHQLMQIAEVTQVYEEENNENNIDTKCLICLNEVSRPVRCP